MKIPTADEFFSQKFNNPHVPLRERTRNEILYVAKEFAKLHVRAALEAAAESADMDTDFLTSQQEGSIGGIDKETILNAYPETLIQ